MADGASNPYGATGFGELLGLFGGANPLAGVAKSVAQFQRGVNQFLEGVEKFNDTLEQLNQVARRVNTLLDTVEEPVKAFVPQVTRTIKATDLMVEQLAGPIERVAPGLQRLGDMLASPGFARLPTDVATFTALMNDLAKRMQPISQMAETAGTMLGLRALTALRSGGGRPEPASSGPTPQKKAAAKKAAPKKKAATKAKAAPSKKKTAAKKTAAKKKAAAKR